MKSVLYSIMLILGMNLMFCSCEKEEGGGKVDETKIEGKWWYPVKAEAHFNGKVVSTVQEGYLMEYNNYKAYFENGNCTCVELVDGYSNVLPYSIIDGVLSIQGFWGAMKFYISKATNKEGVIDMLAEDYLAESLPKDLSSGKVIVTYQGLEIYSKNYNSPFWYYDKKGNAVLCGCYNYNYKSHWDNTKKEEVYDEFTYDFFYDKIRYYFKAE